MSKIVHLPVLVRIMVAELGPLLRSLKAIFHLLTDGVIVKGIEGAALEVFFGSLNDSEDKLSMEIIRTAK